MTARKGERADRLVDFIHELKIAPHAVPTGGSNRAGPFTERRVVKAKLPYGDVEALQLVLAAAAPAQAGQQNMTDGQVADANYAGASVYYNVFFLTSYTTHGGSEGPFYIQFEGSGGTTGLHSFWPFVNQGQWSFKQFYDIYVGRITTIRLAAGTSDGWFFNHLLLLYPRGHIWAIGEKWIQTDGYSVVEMVVG